MRPEGKLKPQTKGNIFLKQFSLPAFLGIHIAWELRHPGQRDLRRAITYE